MTGYWSPMAWVESRLASVAPSRAAGRASSSDSDSSLASPAPSSVDEESLESAFRASFARASLVCEQRPRGRPSQWGGGGCAPGRWHPQFGV